LGLEQRDRAPPQRMAGIGHWGVFAMWRYAACEAREALG